MTKLKQQRQGLPPLDLRVQDHYEELLTISEAAQLSGLSKQFIYQQLKSPNFNKTHTMPIFQLEIRPIIKSYYCVLKY